MDAWWVKNGYQKSWLDSSKPIWREVSFLVSECRRHRSFKANRGSLLEFWPTCVMCGSTERLAVHHIRPLWSLAMDWLCQNLSHDDQSWSLVENWPTAHFAEWNSLDNLALLCQTCHERQETEATKYWKRHLQNSFAPRLYFSTREVSRYFRNITGRRL